MSKDKGGRAVKKPKAAKNVKTSGQTPSAGSGAISATTARGGSRRTPARGDPAPAPVAAAEWRP